MHLSKKSWHFRLATTYNSLPLTEAAHKADADRNKIREQVYQGDLCTYIKHVTLGFLVVLLITFFAIVLSMTALMPVWWAICALINGTWLLEHGYLEFAALPLFFYVVLGYSVIDANACWGKIGNFIAAPFRKSSGSVAEKRDSFMVGAYKTFRHKMCFKLTVD